MKNYIAPIRFASSDGHSPASRTAAIDRGPGGLPSTQRPACGLPTSRQPPVTAAPTGRVRRSCPRDETPAVDTFASRCRSADGSREETVEGPCVWARRQRQYAVDVVRNRHPLRIAISTAGSRRPGSLRWPASPAGRTSRWHAPGRETGVSARLGCRLRSHAPDQAESADHGCRRQPAPAT